MGPVHYIQQKKKRNSTKHWQRLSLHAINDRLQITSHFALIVAWRWWWGTMLLCTIQVFRFVWYPPVTSHEYSIYAKQNAKETWDLWGFRSGQWRPPPSILQYHKDVDTIAQRFSAEIWNMLPGTLLMHNSYGIQLTWPTSRVCVGFCTVFFCVALSLKQTITVFQSISLQNRIDPCATNKLNVCELNECTHSPHLQTKSDAHKRVS